MFLGNMHIKCHLILLSAHTHWLGKNEIISNCAAQVFECAVHESFLCSFSSHICDDIVLLLLGIFFAHHYALRIAYSNVSNANLAFSLSLFHSISHYVRLCEQSVRLFAQLMFISFLLKME